MVLMTCMWARLEILLAYLSASSSIGVLSTRHSAMMLNNIVIILMIFIIIIIKN